MTLFDRQKFDLEIKVPTSIEIVHMKDKVRFRGTKDAIIKFAREFYTLRALNDGQLCKLDKYTLKVSDYITPDRKKENWIELPNHAWGIMASKFIEVPYEYEDNPFDFNDCGYTDRNPFDIGVEVTDLPIRFMEFNKDGTYQYKIIER
ncbi:MAG: hypothetical protein EOP54_10185 [Sphingobacteriales bacterium]|nr:MAG: hypothetical protein EOP54_10185 [Sphingobacteriales bacterium]